MLYLYYILYVDIIEYGALGITDIIYHHGTAAVVASTVCRPTEVI